MVARQLQPVKGMMSAIPDPSPRQAVFDVLNRRRPARVVYAPNYWQWFAHHRRHGTLPEELADCTDQLEMIDRLGLDVFSRNIYCDQRRCWFGGLSRALCEGIDAEETESPDGDDLIIQRAYHTPKGTLTERQRHCHNQSTLVTEEFLVDDYSKHLDAYEALVHARRWQFEVERFQAEQARVGERGVVMVGELYSPLKMLHLDLGPEATTYLLMDHPRRAAELMRVHEEAQVDLAHQIGAAGTDAMIAMDNLDTAFHPPHYVERYSASFYERASRIAHQHGSTFFIHACGQQRANLPLIATLGVDGLEGVAYPPLGDVELEEAMELSGDRFIVTGGISAIETDRLRSRDEVFAYVENLFDRLRPHAQRFILAASCNTAISARWSTLVHFRDAWRELGSL